MDRAGGCGHRRAPRLRASSGIGLVLQPELGLIGAGALWGAQLPVWVTLALKGDKRWDGLLAAWSGAALGGGLVHFSLWPWQFNRLGLPVLTEAEGLPTDRLPAYSAILHLWIAASAMSIMREMAPRDRRWALLGFAMLPLLKKSARHHFAWMTEQAASNPAWWNRGITSY